MFPRVLVATDFSRYADRILECIGQIPGIEEILLVHVLSGADTTAKTLLEEKGLRLRETTGVTVTTVLVERPDGDTAGALIATATREDCSLIVVGARGRNFLGKLLLGSVSREVVTRAGIDVLVMHFPGLIGEGADPLDKFCRNLFSHVLCPVDFSRPSEKTVEYLKTLGFIRRVTFLHVVGGRGADGSLKDQTARAGERLEEIRADSESTGIRADVLVRSADPVDAICRVAEEQDVSLIMIGRFGRTDYASNIPLGRVVSGVADRAQRPLLVLSPHISLTISARELGKEEFRLAEDLWASYHGQKGDPATDRIFGTFVEGMPVAVARCRRHPDGVEVDGVYVRDEFRDRGYARKAVRALVDACGTEPLYMHSTLDLVPFYRTFGFEPIPEHALPQSIRKRFEFAGGNMAGANVAPMRRPAAAA
jgi:nucleotide-binding universal stress UspA family protein